MVIYISVCPSEGRGGRKEEEQRVYQSRVYYSRLCLKPCERNCDPTVQTFFFFFFFKRINFVFPLGFNSI